MIAAYIYLPTYLITHLLLGAESSLQKLTGSQLTKKFASWRFITAFTKARYLFLFLAR